MSYQKPFKGLKVIDFSQGVAGPYCGMLLAQHGAEVIKVEPKDGDWARNLGQEYGEHSAFSVAANLGKKSIIVEIFPTLYFRKHSIKPKKNTGYTLNQ